MAAIATGGAIWALRSILAPLALSIFLLLMIDGLARSLIKRAPWLPNWAALPSAIVFIVVVFAGAIWAIADNAGHFAHQTGLYTNRLNALIQQFATQAGVADPPTVDDMLQDANPGRVVSILAGGLKRAGEGAVFVLIYLGFLLASRQGFEHKAEALFADGRERGEANRVFDRIRVGVESYIWTQTVLGVIIATASALIMMALGLSHPLFWAFLIFLASYIPVIGGAVGVLIPPLFALVELPDLWRPVVMVVALEAVHFVVGHVLQPRMQGKNLNLDPVVVLLSLAFWGLVWGVPGAFLSTPLTVMAMAILAEFSGTRWIAVLLSSDGKPYQDLKP
jgi:predicted PurR-regulated permease PerM